MVRVLALCSWDISGIWRRLFGIYSTLHN